MKKISKAILSLSLILINSSVFAQDKNLSFKTSIDNFIDSYMAPIAGAMIVLGALVGFVKNFDAINDANSAGKRKEGIINLGYIVLYTVVGVAILTLVISKVKNLKLSA